MSINEKPASTAVGGGLREGDHARRLIGPAITPTHDRAQHLRAELVGIECRGCEISTRGEAPILELCRRLIALGHDPGRGLRVYRHGVLAIEVRAIGEAAELTVNGRATGFIKRPAPVCISQPARFSAGLDHPAP
jgi:hypothetical protein